MKCPKCGFESRGVQDECRRCGLIFSKYRRRILPPDSASVTTGSSGWYSLFLHVDTSINPLYFYGRVLVFAGIVVWGISIIATPMVRFYERGWFIHNVNLAFHEAGHTIFRVFGQFIGVLGGSLGQVLIPLICLFALLIKTRDPFGASICLCWVGENLMDVAVYVNDARALVLPLIGGIFGYEDPDFHDWHVILKDMHMLHYDHRIAMTLYAGGIMLMLISFVWGGLMLYLQYKSVKRGADDF
ncbi:MAG: zinc ribbon domain-containing protein [Nitrospirota bacterium]